MVNMFQKIRTDKVPFYSIKWVTIAEIKEFVRKIKRNFIKENNTVMKGINNGTYKSWRKDLLYKKSY